MKITDIHNNLVMHFYRPTRIGFQDSIEVSAPVGQLIGRVVKEISFFPTFKIKNHKNETVLRIEGPAITTGFFSDVEFKVRTFSTTFKLIDFNLMNATFHCKF